MTEENRLLAIQVLYEELGRIYEEQGQNRHLSEYEAGNRRMNAINRAIVALTAYKVEEN